MKKIIFFLILSIIFISCKQEFEPSTVSPSLDSKIEDIFDDSIAGMPAQIKLEYLSDNYKSISATYGDNSEIFLQITWFNTDYTTRKTCFNKFIKSKFQSFKTVKKNKNNFDYFAENDSLYAVSWHINDFIIFSKFQKKYLDNFVINCKYLNYR